jgi:hypothetical protein
MSITEKLLRESTLKRLLLQETSSGYNNSDSTELIEMTTRSSTLKLCKPVALLTTVMSTKVTMEDSLLLNLLTEHT